MKKYRWSSILAALALTLTLIPAAGAVQTPAVSANKGAHEYVNGRRWAQPIKSYLYENQSGGLTRVEYIKDQVVVEDYSRNFALLSSRTIRPELPVWGGFFAGEDYNYLVFGQNNKEENNSTEVFRVVQYGKDWKRLGQASLRGANTIEPFEAGSVRFAEYNGYLYIHTSHKMYTADDGLNHQAGVNILVRQKDMKITDSAYEVGGPGYVSHSFNQFILIDRERNIVTLDHGDAYPRAAVLHKFIAKAGQDSFRQEKRVPADRPGWYYIVYEDEAEVKAFPTAAQHYNDTGCALGGFAETSKGYVTAYQFDGIASNLGEAGRDLYLGFTDKSLSGSSSVRLTAGENVSNPQLVSTGLEGGYVLWNTVDQSSWYTAKFNDTLYFAPYDASGKAGQIKTAQAALSDCQPILWNGKVVWYTTDNSAPVFYLLDSQGVTSALPASQDTTTAPQNVAHASTQSVLVDGDQVEFQAYALWDGNGNPTNYVKLRDLAYVLNGTPAQFQVGWKDGVILTTKTAYTAAGGEMTTPYSGDQPYSAAGNTTVVDGQAARLDAFTIYDSQGGGHTYYKLRDLGDALGFTVDWSPETGVSIRTVK